MQIHQHRNLTPATVGKSLTAHCKENASKLTSSIKPQSLARQQLKPTLELATNFKERYRNHKTFFRHSHRRNETELSKYVWNLHDAKKPFQIKWKILKKCKPYSNISKKCSLCLNEKFIIICKKELCSLNRRNELASSCPHRNRYVLRNFRVT